MGTASYNGCMRTIGIQLLKRKLSEYVRLASGGDIVLVTVRDRVVAELGPPRHGQARSIENWGLADLVRRGIPTLPISRATTSPPSIPRLPLAEILRGLDEDRSER